MLYAYSIAFVLRADSYIDLSAHYHAMYNVTGVGGIQGLGNH